jgi:predicted nucleic acid-binding protein
MDRLFLDANVLFSAAYRSEAGLLRLWQLKDAVLGTSHYAAEEARINLIEDVQRQRLAKLLERMEFCDAPERELPHAISLPEKDVPIILAAIEARATHLLTGDVRHFGPYFGKKAEGVLISLPGEYLKGQSRT